MRAQCSDLGVVRYIYNPGCEILPIFPIPAVDDAVLHLPPWPCSRLLARPPVLVLSLILVSVRTAQPWIGPGSGFLVLLASLLASQLVTRGPNDQLLVKARLTWSWPNGGRGEDKHVVAQLLQVQLLVLDLLLELEKLLLLALSDGVVFASPLATLEGITAVDRLSAMALSDWHGPLSGYISHIRGYGETVEAAYPWPPAFGGAPTSPSAMVRNVVEMARRYDGIASPRGVLLMTCCRMRVDIVTDVRMRFTKASALTLS
jgi:hypothetical protein